MFRTDLRPGEILQIGQTRITLEKKSGQVASLAVHSLKRSIAIFKIVPSRNDEPRETAERVD